MAEEKIKKDEEKITKEEASVKYQSLNLSIIKIRCKLQEAKLNKSGHNKFAGFNYFELADFLPTLNKLMLDEQVNDLFVIKDGVAKLTLIKGTEEQTYEIPFVLFDTPLTLKKDRQGNFLKNKDGEYMQVPSMQDIQYLGALNTYYKRYLYMNAFGITDGDVIDAMDNQSLNGETPRKQAQNKPQSVPQKATQSQIEKIMQLVNNVGTMLKYYKVEKIDDLTVQQASEIISKKTKAQLEQLEQEAMADVIDARRDA